MAWDFIVKRRPLILRFITGPVAGSAP